VFFYFLLFSAVTIYHEIDGCFQLIRYSKNRDKSVDNINGRFSLEIIKAAFLMKMKNKLGGKAYIDTTVCGKLDCETDEKTKEEKSKPNYLFMSRLTLLLVSCGLYKPVNKPLHTIDDISGHTPFVTKSTWGLDTIYCRNRKTRYITVVKGESALTYKQVISSLICYLIGLSFTLIIFVAFMVWFELPAGAIGVICAAYIIWCFWSVLNSATLMNLYDKVTSQKSDTDESEVLYQVRERFQFTEPHDNLCWAVLFLEFLLLFVCPVGSLFHAGNIPVGILFIFVSIITFARRYCNSTVALEEFGTMDGIEADNEKTGDDEEAKEEDWREKHRLGLIMKDISSGRKNDFWLSVFAFFILAFCGVFMVAVWKGADSGSMEGWTYTSKFEYPGSGSLEYTSCTIGQNIVPPDTTKTSLTDFTFLAAVAYESPDITSTSLENWFNHNGTETGKTIDHEEILQRWRSQYEQERGKSAVTYKFLGFPKSDVGVVTIRGTSNGWDALSDAQLWSAASLAQWIRAIMPLGNLFTPVLTYLVEIVSAIESKHLDEVAFYKQTSAFVNHVKNLQEGDEGYYKNIIVTGHSLGGGLAMISGAQQEVPSIALSGPNAVISRRTFNPPITPGALERYTFNIVPDRDVVPRLDDLSQNYQRINCRSGLNDPLSCHCKYTSQLVLIFLKLH
jgi:lipase ATG15